MEIFRNLIGPDDGGQTMAQLSFRAVILLLCGILCVRIAGRRTFAQASPLDIIVALIVGSNLSRIITGGAAFFPGLASTLALVVAHRLLAYAAMRWSALGRLIKCSPVVLARDGQLDRRAMAFQAISEADLDESLRTEQMSTLCDTHLVTLEGGGKISVLPKQRTL